MNKTMKSGGDAKPVLVPGGPQARPEPADCGPAPETPLHNANDPPRAASRSLAATPLPSSQPARRFRVHASVSLQVAAEVIVEASTPEEADRLVETLLQGQSITAQLHEVLELRTHTVPIKRDRQVEVRLESMLLDWPPNAMVWKMTELGGARYQQ